MRLPQVACWGLFGWEHRDSCSLSRSARAELSRVRVRLRSALRGLSGVRVEDKGLAVSVHVRGVPAAIARQARDVLRQTLADFGRHLHVLSGSKVWDVVPREVAGKGIRPSGRGSRRPAAVPAGLCRQRRDRRAGVRRARRGHHRSRGHGPVGQHQGALPVGRSRRSAPVHRTAGGRVVMTREFFSCCLLAASGSHTKTNLVTVFV